MNCQDFRKRCGVERLPNLIAIDTALTTPDKYLPFPVNRAEHVKLFTRSFESFLILSHHEPLFSQSRVRQKSGGQ